MCGQEAELGVVDELDEILDLLLEADLVLVLRHVWVGGLGAGIRVAEA
jgi:hypothetical protein